MIYFLGILISLAAGFLLIRLLTAGRLNLILHILLALVLGLGIDGTAAFYTHILFNQFNRWLPVGLEILGIAIIITFQKILQVSKKKKKVKTKTGLILNMKFAPSGTYWGLAGLKCSGFLWLSVPIITLWADGMPGHAGA